MNRNIISTGYGCFRCRSAEIKQLADTDLAWCENPDCPEHLTREQIRAAQN